MSNWVENEIDITGPKEALDRFKEIARGKDEQEGELLDMDAFIPYPDEFKEQDRIAIEHNEKIESEIEGMSIEDRVEYLKKNPRYDFYSTPGYKWRLENWGTKWNFHETRLVSEDEDNLLYAFLTAWSPPDSVVRKMGEMFPELSFVFKYYEGNMGFHGILIIKSGEVEEDECVPYFSPLAW